MSRNTIYVTGHKNPDSDSIISAMAYAYFKQQMGYDAIAVRIGEINRETEYILSMFNEFAPPLVKNIRTRVRDTDFDDIVTCKPTDTVYTALMKMREHGRKVIAIVDDKRRFLGMATTSDIIKPLIPHQDRNNELIRSTPIEDIASFFDGELVYKDDVQRSIGRMHVMAGVDDKECEDKIVVTGDDSRLHEMAIKNKAATLIATKTDKFSDKVLKLAKKHGCNLVTCDESIYDVIKYTYFATSVDKIMTKDLITFQYDDYIDDVKTVINKTRFRSYPILDKRNNVIGTISRYHVLRHSNRNLILVDHNEYSQSIEGAEEANILEIIDHHRLGGIKTPSPVHFRNEQVGCCATIISKIFQENNVEIPKDLAGLLCCAIISDTVNFKSVTCTNEDIEQAEYLADLSKLDMERIGPKILAAGATLEDKSCDFIFRTDLKQFDINKNKVSVGQSNIVNYESIEPLKEQMQIIMKNYSKDSNSNIVMMVFSLIDGSGSYILAEGPGVNKLEEVFKKKGEYVGEFIFLKDVISRKQQLIPMISDVLE
ncbi:MAG: putative manganese-dependent inorganic diphosphatase [Bacillota bacterium]|jgi:manganese-dependent inorganic pyrophosphatase|nr:putative manganese-dependent inorganic diphosphatase [Bacillota bacterium]NLL25974.1 putative manganese-dependent inorganic diphosphatase [Erysipelotrichia bacterium]